VHRDLKPENIMLLDLPAGRHHVKVLDFGLAWLASESTSGPRLTQMGMVFGTPEYMAPEQAMGQDTDARADLYALGVILFQGLAGRLPYEREQPILVLQAHVSSPVPELPESVDPRLAALVRRALAKSPEDRFPSAAAMAAALQETRRVIEEQRTHKASVEQVLEEEEVETQPLSEGQVSSADAPTEQVSYDDVGATLVEAPAVPAPTVGRGSDPTLEAPPVPPAEPDPTRPPLAIRFPSAADSETVPMRYLPDEIPNLDPTPQNLRPVVTVRVRSRRTWPLVALAVAVAVAAVTALVLALAAGGGCGS